MSITPLGSKESVSVAILGETWQALYSDATIDTALNSGSRLRIRYMHGGVPSGIPTSCARHILTCDKSPESAEAPHLCGVTVPRKLTCAKVGYDS